MLRTLMFQISSSIDSLTRATQIMVEYNEVDDGSGCSNDFDKKFAS